MFSETYKIAIVIPKYGLTGGAETFTAEITERIALDRRFEIHVFANKWREYSDRIIFHHVPIISFPKFLTTISFACFAKYQISKIRADLIHAHDRIFNADIFTMHGIPHRIWVKEVRKKHRSLFDYGTEWVEDCLIKYGKCKRFLAVSMLARQKFLDAYPDIPSDHVEVIYPGVDNNSFQNLDRQVCRQKIRKQYGIDPSATVILFVSMNFEIKGLDSIMSGLARYKAKYEPGKFILFVVGKGNARKYSKLAHNLGIKEHVIFSGALDKEELNQIYLSSDIFPMLSEFDTFGISVSEAMAASLPVIISTNVGAKDLVRNGINGWVIDKDDIDQFAEKMLLLSEESVRHRMGQHALETAKVHTWDSATNQIMKIYEELLSARIRPGRDKPE